jgi:dethiobiotin synthetase
LAVDQGNSVRPLIVGTIGHVDHGKTTLTAALLLLAARAGVNAIEMKPEVIYITAPQIEPIDRSCVHYHRKSKGDKRRDRSERRRKWGI